MGKLRKQEVPKDSKNLLVSNARAIFRVAFAGEAQKGYDFKDCNNDEWHCLGKFIDNFAGKPISEVNTRKRKPDRTMTASDPLSETDKHIEHYQVQGKQRVHGYYN